MRAGDPDRQDRVHLGPPAEPRCVQAVVLYAYLVEENAVPLRANVRLL
jgi:hypothetical protein